MLDMYLEFDKGNNPKQMNDDTYEYTFGKNKDNILNAYEVWVKYVGKQYNNSYLGEYTIIYSREFYEFLSQLNLQIKDNTIAEYDTETISEIEGNHNYSFNLYEMIFTINDKGCFEDFGRIIRRSYNYGYNEIWYDVLFGTENNIYVDYYPEDKIRKL